MKKAISLILALLAAVGKECYQTFALGLAHLVAKVRAVKLSRGEAVAYAVGNLATWLLLVAGYLVK